jgi:hypothetical protein
MRIGKAVILPAILALGAAGSILTASALPAAAAQTHATHAPATSSHIRPHLHYHS